jgi:serine O-acetyltransferase
LIDVRQHHSDFRVHDGVRPALFRKLWLAVYKILFKFVQIITGIELPCEAMVGRNFVIDHFGGIIVSGYARFGDNCRIRNGVVVGLRPIGEPLCSCYRQITLSASAPNCRDGSGANFIIGANAVVLDNVPENSIAIGVPAIIKPRRSQYATSWVT